MSLESDSSRATPEWVSSLIGSRLERVRALSYFSSDHSRIENFELELENDRGALWTVHSGPDGESISIRRGAINAANAVAVPDIGYSKIVNETNPELALALHKTIEAVTSFLEFDVGLIGIRLIMIDRTSLAIFNAGDRLVLLVNQEDPLASTDGVTSTEYRG